MRQYRVLVVDDNPENLKVIGNVLDGKGMELSFATSGTQALQSAAVSRPDLILLDVAMPDLDGFEVARRLKAAPDLRSIPVIFITARARSEDVVDGFGAGGVDYITKPFKSAELVARVLTHLEIARSRGTIAEQNASLRELNAGKDRLLSILAHDLKSPLSGIICLSELLVDKGDQIEESSKRGHLRSIHATAQQMTKTLAELLDWARVQSGAFEWKPEPFVLSSIVEESILLAQSPALAKGVAIANRVRPGDRVFADPIMILTATRNLLQNAVKYTRRGGEVTIGSKRHGNDRVKVWVSDTGIGMRPARVASLFRLESRASEPGTEGERGTGLGLMFCQAFLAKHDTTLEVESTEGKGSTFSFSLQAAPEDEGSSGPSAASKA
jgi:two-component system, sensor histidine kinase and response regulator